MRARSVAILFAVFTAVALFVTFTAALSQALHAQQPANPAGTNPSTAIPADAQANLDKLQAGLKAEQDKGDAAAQAKALNAIGDLYFGISAYQQALDNYNQALAQARVAKDAEQEAAALNGIGSYYRSQSQNTKALETYQQALDVATASGDLRGQATALMGLGWVNRNMGQPQKAMDLENRALPLAQKLNDQDLVAKTLLRLGVVYDDLGDHRKALDTDSQALSIFRQVGDRANEGKALTNIGAAFDELGEMQKALDTYSQALPLFRQAGDRAAEANVLTNTGNVYIVLGQEQKALDYFNQSLPIFRLLGIRTGEAITLTNMGLIYVDLGEPQKALECFNRALPVDRAIGDRDDEAATLNNISLVYYDLGEIEKALGFQTQALSVFQQIGDRGAEAISLQSIGSGYEALGERQKALGYHNQSLLLFHEIGNRDGEAISLLDIGNETFKMGEPQKALQYFNQALPLLRQVGDRRFEAETLNDLGDVYRSLGNVHEAFDYYNQALAIATAIRDPLREANIFYSLMVNEKNRQPSLAIFYGKQAVNQVQQVRGNLQGLDKELQKSFVSLKSDYFHDLANLLIDQGRLPEAQQVLDLLKQQEYSDYVRGKEVNPAGSLSLTPAEQQAEADYQKTTAQLVSLGEQWSNLKKIASRTPEQEQQYQQLSDQLTKASQEMNGYYSRLYTLFGQNSGANRQVADVKGDVNLLKQTIAKMPHTVALYTLVAKDRYSVIVITPSTMVAREYPIAENDLNQKVAALQQALRDPGSDARPAASEIYRILVGPIKADLDQAHAQTLVWSLDGILRYVPMAALYDGKRYVVQQYNTVTITPASIAHLSDQPDVSNLSAAAMGISRKYEENLPALPAVAGELDEIVKDAQVQGANGVLPGTILLNDHFTEKAMESQLSGQHAVVHIASHFVFEPGDDTKSYLLLAGKDESGTGFHLTVADFRDNQNLALDDTDLLTLSACETGMSGSASNGREVDGLGTTAQLKGAKAVISSLWEVNDASTGELMADFYKRWADGAGKVMKVEALREAQLDLLLGKTQPQSGASGRGVTVAESEGTPASGFAHPYYWAPFVLMGNWR